MVGWVNARSAILLHAVSVMDAIARATSGGFIVRNMYAVIPSERSESRNLKASRPRALSQDASRFLDSLRSLGMTKALTAPTIVGAVDIRKRILRINLDLRHPRRRRHAQRRATLATKPHV